MIDSFSGEFEFLSNFYPCEVEMDGLMYPSVEHAFQAAKTKSSFYRNKIRKAATPGKAKRLGRQVTLRSDWEGIKVDVMHSLLQKKFANGTELAKLLLSTVQQSLIEGNHWNDTFWGVCRGKGRNELGKLLMLVRNELSI